MNPCTDVLWLNVNPALQRFHRPLLQSLSQTRLVRSWDYRQTLDEPLSLDLAVDLLHDYLAPQTKPVHLVGHSTGGLVGLLYARRYPQWVQSLSLLSVGVSPTVDWQMHYYHQAQLLRCSRTILLAQMVYNLFGEQSRKTTQALIQILDQDLLTGISPHTLAGQLHLSPEEVPVPVCICGGEADIIIDPNLYTGWQAYLQPPGGQDRIWRCPNGGHFFHFDYPDLTAEQLCQFWQSTTWQSTLFQPTFGYTYSTQAVHRVESRKSLE